MFRATLQEIGIIKDSLDSISALITEGTFKIDENGFHLTAMDPASVAMVDFLLLPSAFLDFSTDESTTLTLSIPNFVEILKRAKANDQISFELEENKMKITMQGDFKRTFSLPLIDTAMSSQSVPELDFKAKIEITSSALKDGVKDAAMVSDCVIFESEDSKFSIKSFGDTSETHMELLKDSQNLASIETSGVHKSKYSIDYLDKILKGSKVSDTVMLRYSADYPLRIDCTVIDKLRLSFILAPRVDTD